MGNDSSDVFRRDEAMQAARLSDELFQATFRQLNRNAFVDNSVLLVDRDRIVAVAKAAGGAPVVGNVAAAILHGITWYEPDFDVDLLRLPTGSSKAVGGGRSRRPLLLRGDVMEVEGIKVTTPVRTAADLGRSPPLWRSMGYLDDLMRATQFSTTELLRRAEHMKGYRNVRQLRYLATLPDPGAESPPECWVRLLIIKEKLPRPETQIKVCVPRYGVEYRLDMGYRAIKLGIEYDGTEFHSLPEDRANDEIREHRLNDLGWKLIRVNADRLRDPSAITAEIRREIRGRGGLL